jgi:hypothetical protein
VESIFLEVSSTIAFDKRVMKGGKRANPDWKNGVYPSSLI